MELYYRKIGKGTPLIICHGLYGMSENWLPIAKALSNSFEIYLPDMRNHGLSPHSQNHSYKDLSKDIYELIIKNNLKDVTLIGHSMGGKACMQLAVNHPKTVKRLVVIDISPKEYKSKNTGGINHNKVLNFMINTNFSEIKLRTDITNLISNNFSDNFTRQFLLKNIKRGKSSKYEWKLNAKTLLEKHYEILRGVNFDNKKILCPTLFLKGANSNYISKEDEKFIHQNFGNAIIDKISSSGHFIHVENPLELINMLNVFLSRPHSINVF